MGDLTINQNVSSESQSTALPQEHEGLQQSTTTTEGSLQGVPVRVVPTEAELQNEIADRADRASWCKDVEGELPEKPNQLHFKLSNQKEIFYNNCLKEMERLKKRDSSLASLVDDWTAAFQQAQEATTPEEGKELLARKEAILKEITKHIAAYENPDRRTKFQDQLHLVQAHENAMTKLDEALGTKIPFGKQEAQEIQLSITTARKTAEAHERQIVQRGALNNGLLNEIATPKGSVEKYIEEHSKIINTLVEIEPSLTSLAEKWTSAIDDVQKSFSINEDDVEQQAKYEKALINLYGIFALIEKQALRSPQAGQLESLLSVAKHFDRAEEILQQANKIRRDLVKWTQTLVLTPDIIKDVYVAIELKSETIHDLAAAAQNMSKLSKIIVDYYPCVAETETETMEADEKTLSEAITGAEAAIKNYSNFALAVEMNKPQEVCLPFSYQGRMKDAEVMKIKYDFCFQAADPKKQPDEKKSWRRAIFSKQAETAYLLEAIENGVTSPQAEAYNKKAREFNQSAACHELAVLSYQAAAASSQNGEKEVAAFQGLLGQAQHNLGVAYYNAAKQEAAGEPEKVESFRKVIPFYAAAVLLQQEALKSFRRGETELAAFQDSLGGSQCNLGATYFDLAEQEKDGNPEKAELFRKVIPFYAAAVLLQQEALKSFRHGETELAAFQRALGRAQYNLGVAYYNAAKQEAAGEPEKAELFREAIPFYEASISSCQEALNSFRRGEKELAELQQEFQSYPFRIGVVYEFAAYEEVTENLKKAGLFRKAIPFYQEALRLGQESLESFKKGNMELATSQQALAREQDKLGGACFNAAKQQRSER